MIIENIGEIMNDGLENSGKTIKNEIKSKSSKLVSVGVPVLGFGAGLMFKDFFGIQPKVLNFLIKRSEKSKASSVPTAEQLNSSSKMYSAVIYLMAGALAKAFVGGLVGKIILFYSVGASLSFYWSF